MSIQPIAQLVGGARAAPGHDAKRNRFWGGTISLAHLIGRHATAARRAAPVRAEQPAPPKPSAAVRAVDAAARANPADQAAARRERERCAAIFRSPAAATRLDVAAHLAFNTDLPRRAAIDLLRRAAAGSPPPRSDGGLRARRPQQPSPRLEDGDSGPSGGSPQAIALQCLCAAGIAPNRRTP